MKRLHSRLGRLAEFEVDEAFDWYVEKTPQAAAGFLEDFHRALQMIELFPEGGRVLEGDVRQCPLSRYPYHIIYVRKRTLVHVVALGHSGRGPSYWRAVAKRL